MNDHAPPLSNHPSATELREFGLGRLDDPTMDRISDHIALCDTCCQKLAQVHDDTLMEMCKAAGGETEVAGGQTLNDAALSEARQALEAAFKDHPRYRLRSPLGHGGMGLVYKAEHRLMDRLVAIKVIHPALTANATAIDRFQREIKAAGKLNHPNIVAALDAEQTGPFHCLVMEFAQGVSLDRIVKHRGILHAPGACRIVQQAAHGLAHAHQRGMVHRDIKPHNLLATLDGQVKILDFGLARFASEQRASSDLTGDGMLGTPEYMSPEQIERANEADIRSDIYSLGCTLYYLLLGRSPFQKPGGQTHTDLLLAHLNAAPPTLMDQRSDIPPRLEQIVMKMLSKDPARRFQEPAEVAAAMEEIIRGTAAHAVLPQTTELLEEPDEILENDVPIELVATGPREIESEPPTVHDLRGIAAEIGADPHGSPVASDPIITASQQPTASRTLARRRERRGTPRWIWGIAGVGCIAIVAMIVAFSNDRDDGSNNDPPVQVGASATAGGQPGSSSLPTANGKPQVLMLVPSRYWANDYHPLHRALLGKVSVVETAVRRNVTNHEDSTKSRTVEKLIGDINPAEYAGVIVIGGTTDHAYRNEIDALLRSFRQSPNKFVAGICRGQVILNRAGVLEGCKVSQPGKFNTDETEHGVHRLASNCYTDSENNVITATAESDVEAFAQAIIRWLQQRA